MKRLCLLIKLFMGNLLLVGAVVAVGLIVSYDGLNTWFMRHNRTAQDQAADMAARYFEDTPPATQAQLNQAVRELLGESEMRLTVIADDGGVLGDSIADPTSMDKHNTPDRPEVLAAIEGRNGADTRRSKTTSVEYRYVTRPVMRDGKVAAVVRLAMPVRAIAEDRSLVRETLVWTISATSAVAAALAILMSWIWYAPLNQITRTAEQLAAGNLDARAEVSGADELAGLARTLNGMRDNLARQIRAAETQRRQLSSVVESLREGVVALDKTGHIVLVNSSAFDLLDLDEADLTGREFKSVITGGQVLDLYYKLMSAGESVDGQAHDGGRTLDIHAARVKAGSPGGIAVLMVLRDVTEIERASAMKAEFVANASHELRTPLATIRAAAETLGDSADSPQAVEKVAAILDRHITRLEQMTNDLLNLHLIETSSDQGSVTEISLDALAEHIRDDHGNQSRDAGVDLSVSIDPDDFTFKSNITLWRLIVDNLVGNALKFTPGGGMVTCRLTGRSGGVTLNVTDTGGGIPPEIQARVFERFFQAAACRSGDAAVRGTGLGLAIVKHAIDRLGGSVWLESAPGEGTSVTIELPLKPDEA